MKDQLNNNSSHEVSETRVVRTPVLFSRVQYQTTGEILNNASEFRYAPGMAMTLERKPLTEEQEKFLGDLILSTEAGSPEAYKLFQWVTPTDPYDPDMAMLINVPFGWFDRTNEVFFKDEVIPPLKDFKIEEEGEQ